MIKWIRDLFGSKSTVKDRQLLDELEREQGLKFAQERQDIEDSRLERKAKQAGFKMYQDWCNYQFTTSAAFDRKYFGIKWPNTVLLLDLWTIITEHSPAKSKHDTASLRKIANDECNRLIEEWKQEMGDYFITLNEK